MPKTDVSSLYAAHPHLSRIDTIWGTRECRNLINKLMNDTRDGSRAGFAPDHAHAIFALLMEHDELFPEFETGFQGGWLDLEQRRSDGK